MSQAVMVAALLLGDLLWASAPPSAQSTTPHPTAILQIYRDFLKPGSEAAYREIEEEIARTCIRLKCPNPYLAIEAQTGPKEVWYLNGYRSAAHEKAVADGYQVAGLTAAFAGIAERKAALILTPVNLRTVYRADLAHDPPWQLGDGRFLIITITNREQPHRAGSVFETTDGVRFIIRSAQSQREADLEAAGAHPEARVFAVRPTMSLAAPDWVTRDPEFWRANVR